MILLIFFFFISLSAQQNGKPEVKSSLAELLKHAPESFRNHLSSIPEKILSSYDESAGNPPNCPHNPLAYYNNNARARINARKVYEDACKDLETWIDFLRCKMRDQADLHKKALKLADLHKRNEKLLDEHVLRIRPLALECPQAFKSAQVDGKELFLGFHMGEVSAYLKKKKYIKDAGVLYQFLKLLDFTLTDQEASQMNNKAQNIFEPYADSSIRDSADYLRLLNEESAGSLEKFFLYQMFLEALKYSKDKNRIITCIHKEASEMHEQAHALNVFFEWRNPSDSRLNTNNIKRINLPLFNYESTLGKLADLRSEIKPDALRILFTISAFSLNIEEKITPGGYSTFGPKYLEDGSFGDLCKQYPAKLLIDASDEMFSDYICLLQKRLKDKSVLPFLEPVTQLALNRISGSTVIKNPSIEPPIKVDAKAKEKKKKKKKKKPSSTRISQSGSLQSEDSLPNSDSEDDDDQAHYDVQDDIFNQDPKIDISREPVSLPKKKSVVFEEYKAMLDKEKSELQILWGPDMYNKIVTWMKQICVYEKKENKFSGSVFYIEDTLKDEKITLYNFKKQDPVSLSSRFQNYAFADRVKKVLEKILDNPEVCSRSEALHSINPFVISLVSALGDVITHVSKNKGQHQCCSVMLASLQDNKDSRREVVMQIAKDEKGFVYHSIAKPLNPDGLADLISFYGNTDKDNVVIPQVYWIEEEA